MTEESRQHLEQDLVADVEEIAAAGCDSVADARPNRLHEDIRG